MWFGPFHNATQFTGFVCIFGAALVVIVSALTERRRTVAGLIRSGSPTP
jgi:hypothetical protein